jgi:hypothetical protein
MTDADAAVQRLYKRFKVGKHGGVFVATFVCMCTIALEVVWDEGKQPRLTKKQMRLYREQHELARRAVLLPVDEQESRP